MTALEHVHAMKMPEEVPAGVTIRVLPPVGRIIPVFVALPDNAPSRPNLFRNNAFAVAEDGTEVLALSPLSAANAAGGAQPLVSAITDESDFWAVTRSLMKMWDNSFGGTMSDWDIAPFKHQQLYDWSLRSSKENPDLGPVNEAFVYFPLGRYRTFKIAVFEGTWSQTPMLLTAPWPTPSARPPVTEAPTSARPAPAHP